MLALITGRFAPYLWAGAAALFALAAGWIVIQGFRLDAAEATMQVQREQLDQAAAANASLVETLERRDAWQARQLAALEATHREARARTARTTQQIEAIRNAPLSDDGPVAPVLRRLIDSMRQPGAASGADANGAPKPAP